MKHSKSRSTCRGLSKSRSLQAVDASKPDEFQWPCLAWCVSWVFDGYLENHGLRIAGTCERSLTKLRHTTFAAVHVPVLVRQVQHRNSPEKLYAGNGPQTVGAPLQTQQRSQTECG
eukprot:1059679-Amphidinium_carterae.1